MSAKSVAYHEDAIADVESAVDWYKNRSLSAAAEFIEELNRASDTIREAPERWPRGKNDTRRFLLWRFPFVVPYSDKGSEIIIWAVARGSRRPEYWIGRI